MQSNQNVLIREAVAADWAEIKNLIRMYPKELIEVHLPSFKSFFVAESSGQLVGCCALAVQILEDPSPDDMGSSPKNAEVRSLAVHPDFQGQGIASSLIKKCVELAEKKGIWEIVVYTGAEELFSKLGFSSNNGYKFVMFRQLKK